MMSSMMNESGEDGRPQRRSDGEQTHAAILDQAMRLASVEGLSNLTIGRLADAAGISKSGLYAHFGSKERLQIETIEAAREVFTREVILPGMDEPAGIGQLRALCLSYLSYVERRVFPGGCFFYAVISEFDARSGPIHEEIANDNREWLGLLRANVIEAQAQGEIAAGIDPDQLVFELEAAMELANCLYTLHGDPVAIERARLAVRAALERSSR
jgi:AcrR family transcriptional regulator